MYTKSLKFRLYPTPHQVTTLNRILETCCDVYNSLLNERKHDYELLGKAPSRYDQQKHIPEWRGKFPEIESMYAQVLQEVVLRVDRTFNLFFTRFQQGKKPGFPRMKRSGYDSFTYPQKGFKVLDQSVYLSKIGTIKAIVHRVAEGNIKNCTICRKKGKWFACFAVEVESEPLPESTEIVGIDVGLEKFAAFSNGEFIDNPRFFRNDEKALKKAQRKLSAQKRGSQKRRKAKKVVSRIHERIGNRRHDFVHQTARRIVNRFGFIAVEKLNVKNMSQSPAPKQDEATGEFLPNGHAAKAGLNKSILDAAWSMFRQVLTFKAESAGRKYVEVNPAYTSQDCSGCGYRAKKKLSERWHFCPHCGLSLDRDTNAAMNILQIGLKNGMGLHTVVGMPT